MIKVRLRWMRWVGNATCMEEVRIVYTILFRKPEWKRPLEKPRH
jgi:hypothetical protein